MHHCQVLIVDDESAILDLMRTVFERSGFQVTTAASACEAISLLQSPNFDVVLTDLRMEAPLAGFDVVRAARQVQPHPFIGIVTAFPVSPADWKDSGADALFVKGLDTFRLPEKVSALLKLGPEAAMSGAETRRRATS